MPSVALPALGTSRAVRRIQRRRWFSRDSCSFFLYRSQSYLSDSADAVANNDHAAQDIFLGVGVG